MRRGGFRFRLNTQRHQSSANAAGSHGGFFRFQLFLGIPHNQIRTISLKQGEELEPVIGRSREVKSILEIFSFSVLQPTFKSLDC
jgi:hypothetical protein